MTKILCDVFKSAKKEGVYLYVKKQDSLKRVPDALLEQFGSPVLALTLVVDAARKFASVDTSILLSSLDVKGFYLQLPPPLPQDRRGVSNQNHKLACS